MSGIYASLSNEQLQQHINALWNKLNTLKPTSVSVDVSQLQTDLDLVETDVAGLLNLINNLQGQVTTDVNNLVSLTATVNLINQLLNDYILTIDDLMQNTIPSLQSNVNQALFDANAAMVAASTAQSDVNTLENQVAVRTTALLKHRYYTVPATTKSFNEMIILNGNSSDVLARNGFADVVTIGTLDGSAYYDLRSYPDPNTFTVDTTINVSSFRLELAFWLKYQFSSHTDRNITMGGGARPNELLLAMKVGSFSGAYTYAGTVSNADTVVPFHADVPVVDGDVFVFYVYHSISHTSYGTAGVPVHFRLLSRVSIVADYIAPNSINISLASFSLRPIIVN